MKSRLEDFDGKLAAVYQENDPIRMVKTYTVFFVDDGEGKPLKSSVWPELVGAYYEDMPNGAFVVYIRETGKRVVGKFLKVENYEVDITLNDLSKSEHRKRADYLKRNGYLALDTFMMRRKITLKDARIILSSRTWDELYEKIPEIADRLYSAITKYHKEFDEAPPAWRGVFWETKEGQISWEIGGLSK